MDCCVLEAFVVSAVVLDIGTSRLFMCLGNEAYLGTMGLSFAPACAPWTVATSDARAAIAIMRTIFQDLLLRILYKTVIFQTRR